MVGLRYEYCPGSTARQAPDACLARAVYAVGLYVDQQAAKELLGPTRGQQTTAELQVDQSLLDGWPPAPPEARQTKAYSL